jgi:sugar (pentulose or hexulose) kinase
MTGRATVVLDVGKTLAKLSLWDHAGALIQRCARPNARIDAGDYSALDTGGIEDWLQESLANFARLAKIGAIIPVGHGAAAAIVRDGKLACAPMDYETPMPAALRAQYDLLRDPFGDTGSPALRDGLNLGAQLFWLGKLHPGLYAPGTQIIPWPQYWAWQLSGVAASEVTSLGCHTDLWRPAHASPSRLVERCGWTGCLPGLRGAADVLGPITPAWAARTGLPADTRIHCGLHDSNAALLAARGFAEIADHESTVLSTGTWFVAMRTPADGVRVEISSLPASRDCLVNVDAYGKPVPSSRFMGGREIEALTGTDSPRVDTASDQSAMLAAVPDLLASCARVLPTFAPGFGPFPHARGRWIDRPADPGARRSAVCLYAALIADAALDLIGARERILIEGRFAQSQVFARGLASLRRSTRVFASNFENDVSYGARRLVDPALQPTSPLQEVAPLDADLGHYAQIWQRDAQRLEAAA